MATKNGVCPHCNFSRLENRIFKVNPDASTVYCPFCMRELDPKQSIDLYNNIIAKMLKKADDTLFIACDPTLAYQEYADVLEVEPRNSKALLGRILCLIYTSKVRHSYLVEATELLETITHKGVDEVATYIEYLKRIDFALDEFDVALNRRLTYRNYFYDEECLKLYLKHLYDIIKFKENILKKAKEIKRDYVTQNNDMFINRLNHSINEKTEYLKNKNRTIDGSCYQYLKYYQDKVFVEKLEEVERFKNHHKIKKHTLKEGVRGYKTIKDTAFKDYTTTIYAKTGALVSAIFFTVAAITLGIFAFIYRAIPIYFYSFIAGGSLALAIAITSIIFHLIWKSILKKRKMRIDY